MAPETMGLEDEFSFGARLPARCELLVLGECTWIHPEKKKHEQTHPGRNSSFRSPKKLPNYVWKIQNKCSTILQFCLPFGDAILWLGMISSNLNCFFSMNACCPPKRKKVPKFPSSPNGFSPIWLLWKSSSCQVVGRPSVCSAASWLSNSSQKSFGPILRFKKETHTSCEPRKKPSYFPLYWLFNRGPYNGLL